MKILFLSDNFPPERNAPASRTYEHALEWVKNGHEVTVITTAPNFPEGAVFPGYRNRLKSRETIDGIHVIRVLSFIAPNSGFIRRTFDYLSFMITGGFAALIHPRPDVLVTTSPQFFCAVAGWIVSRLRRLHWVFELRDLWPASIVALGAMKHNLTLRLLERLELRMYKDADAIVSVTRAFQYNLVSRGVPAEKIHLVMNGVDLERYRPIPKDNRLLEEFDLNGKFVVGYLGTHGLAHALGRVVEAAALLEHRQDIVFIFAGAGATRAEVEHNVRNRALRNVRMLPAQPKQEMQRLWSIHDLALIPLANHELFRTVIPSKMFEAMGMGVPILMSIPEGEATELLRETGAGVAITPEDPQAMADAIVALAEDPSRRAAISEAGENSATRYSRPQQAALMLQILKQVAGTRGQANSFEAENAGKLGQAELAERGSADRLH